MNNKCVYRHRRLDTNEIFYVGIGNDKRPYDFNKRNRWWKNIFNLTGINVEVLYDNLTWEDSCELEEFLISIYGRKDISTGTLVNLTNGGDGIVDYKHTKEHINKITGSGNYFYNKSHSKETKYKIAEKNGYKVINVMTGEKYNTIKEAALKEKIDYSWLKKKLRGGLYKNLKYET